MARLELVERVVTLAQLRLERRHARVRCLLPRRERALPYGALLGQVAPRQLELRCRDVALDAVALERGQRAAQLRLGRGEPRLELLDAQRGAPQLIAVRDQQLAEVLEVLEVVLAQCLPPSRRRCSRPLLRHAHTRATPPLARLQAHLVDGKQQPPPRRPHRRGVRCRACGVGEGVGGCIGGVSRRAYLRSACRRQAREARLQPQVGAASGGAVGAARAHVEGARGGGGKLGALRPRLARAHELRSVACALLA